MTTVTDACHHPIRELTAQEIDRIIDGMERRRPIDPWHDTSRPTDPGPRSPYDDDGYLRFENPVAE